MASWIRHRARTLVGSVRSRGRAELRSQLAAPLAAETVLATLSLAAEPAQALEWYREIVAAVTDLSAGDPMPVAGPAAFDQLRAAVAATPSDQSDVIDSARAALPETEVAANVAVVMFGAIETTEGAIANLFWHLFDTGAWETIRNHPGSLDGAIEESLRLEPAAGRVDRYTTHDVTIAGAAIPSGDLVIVSLTAANRDPSVFAEPDRFRLDRPNVARHLTFARGPHMCIGAHLARLEMAAAVGAVLDELPDVRLVAEESTGPHGLVFRKAQRIDVAWG